MKAYLRQFFHLLETNPSWLNQPQTQRLIIEDCLPLLIDTIRFGDQLSLAEIATLRRYEMVKAVEDFILQNIDQPLTLKDLYTAVNTSSRALSYGIQDLFNMSPMAYLKIKRLNGVRRALITCDRTKAKISHIAGNWGFWSMGHFARDYQQLFGESPSETLKQNST